MRKLFLSIALALMLVGTVAVSSADARPWRGRGYFYRNGYYPTYSYPGYYGAYYYAPGYYYGR